MEAKKSILTHLHKADLHTGGKSGSLQIYRQYVNQTCVSVLRCIFFACKTILPYLFNYETVV